jgi:hypothetical protein
VGTIALKASGLALVEIGEICISKAQYPTMSNFNNIRGPVYEILGKVYLTSYTGQDLL